MYPIFLLFVTVLLGNNSRVYHLHMINATFIPFSNSNFNLKSFFGETRDLKPQRVKGRQITWMFIKFHASFKVKITIYILVYIRDSLHENDKKPKIVSYSIFQYYAF